MARTTEDTRLPLARIVGGGLAGSGAACSLGSFGWQACLSASEPRTRQCVALNGASQFLIERLWGKEVLAAATLHRLHRRVMAWRVPGGAEAMQDEAIVVDVATLTALLLAGVAVPRDSEGEADWTFIAAGRPRTPVRRLTGGTRTATAVEVDLSPGTDVEALLIEATGSGWLALMPTGGRRATLFTFAPRSHERLAELVGASHLVRRALAGRAAGTTTFDAMPTFALMPSDAVREFMIGSAALTFDPLSGDGVAASLRGAHLAASLAQAHRQGADLAAVRASYVRRLARATQVHLQGLEALYAQAPFAAAWAGEIAAIAGMARALEPLAADESVPSFAVSEGGVTALTTP